MSGLKGAGVDDGDDEGGGGEVLAGGVAVLGGGDGLVGGVFGVEVLVAQAVKLVDGDAHGVASQILAGDFSLADDFGLGAAKFFVRQAVSAKEGGLGQEFFFDFGQFFGGGSDVEGEIAGSQAEEI